MSSSQGVNANTVSGYPFDELSVRDASDWIRYKKQTRIYQNYNPSSTDNKDTEPVWIKYGNDIRLDYNFGNSKCEDCDGSPFNGVITDGPSVPPVGDGLTYTAYAFSSEIANDKPDLKDDPSTWGTLDNTKLTLPNISIPQPPDGQFIGYYNATGQPEYDNIAIHMVGYFRAPISGNYVFDVSSDDGFQLKVDGLYLLDNPGRVTNGSQVSSFITLVGGQKYSFEGFWSNGTGGLQLTFNNITVDGQSLPNDLNIPIYSCLYTTL